MLFYDNTNIGILEMKAAAQETEFEYIEAISTYERLYDVTSDFKYAVSISKILVEDSNFIDAFKWAKEAVESAESNPNQEGKGEAVKKKEDTHRMAEANKAFSHFRF